MKSKLMVEIPAFAKANAKWIAVVALCSVVLIAGATVPSALQNLESRRDMEKLTGDVMRAVVAGELEQAYAALKANVTLPPEEIDAGMRSTLMQRNAQFDARYGPAVGFELIGSKKLGDSLWRFTYVEQRELQPLIWTFQFYSSGEGWVMHEFGWSPQTAALYLQN
ncbi:hypothetical protein [Zhongshania aliphaticivorans]|uniref:hypothetical protein n=1 Tax=Zhongshania aliphaticivorans TaxID=1470434 RepID=UPI0012E5B514|nr:hypothetical protein [Zhongshania aliphaticivorans]CAA0092458.1 Uncharacterised protein [Zhongshania aliphaticivorans]